MASPRSEGDFAIPSGAPFDSFDAGSSVHDDERSQAADVLHTAQDHYDHGKVGDGRGLSDEDVEESSDMTIAGAEHTGASNDPESYHDGPEAPVERTKTFLTAGPEDDEKEDRDGPEEPEASSDSDRSLSASAKPAVHPQVQAMDPWRLHADRGYYDALPFAPGPEMLFHLRPLASKRSKHKHARTSSGKGPLPDGLRANPRDGCLHLLMPDTAVIGRRGRRLLLRFSPKVQGIVADQLEADAWEEALCKRWLAKARPVGAENEPIVAVQKIASWKHCEGTEARAVNAATLLAKLEQRPGICVLQRFVKPKGAKPSVYRATWRRSKAPRVINITGFRTFSDAVRHVHAGRESEVTTAGRQRSQASSSAADVENRIAAAPRAQHFFEERLLSAWFCPSAADADKTATFKVATLAVQQVQEALARVVKHMEASIAHDYGLRRFAFEQLQCDFVRSAKDEWVLVNVRGFELTPEAYREAHLIELETRQRREAQGDYYDSEDEDAHIKQRRQRIRQAHAQERSEALTSRAAGTRRLCAMCSRPILLDEKLAPSLARSPGARRADASLTVSTAPLTFIGSEGEASEASSETKSSQRGGAKAASKSGKNASKEREPAHSTPFEMTTVLARGLRAQLMLRGRRVVAFDNCLFAKKEARFETGGELGPGSSAAVGKSFQVCRLCHALWEANANLVQTGKEIGASWLAHEAAEGAPGRRHQHATKTTEADAEDRVDRIVLPGAPSYGPKPGSRAGFVYTGSEDDICQPVSASAKMASTTAGVVGAQDARDTKMNPAHARVQFRLVIFLQSIHDVPPGPLALQYRFHPWAGPVRIDKEDDAPAHDGTPLREIRIHYFMASKPGLQQLFMQPWRVELTAGGVDGAEPEVFRGELFLTRFLASFAKHSLVNFNLRLDKSSRQTSSPLGTETTPLLRCAVGIIRDDVHVADLDPGMPLAVDGAVLHLPPNYFDLRPLPDFWLASIIAGQPHARVEDAVDVVDAEKGLPAPSAGSAAAGTRASPLTHDKGHLTFASADAHGGPRESLTTTTRSIDYGDDVLRETERVIRQVVHDNLDDGEDGGGGHAKRLWSPTDIPDSADTWKHAAAFFDEVQEACEGLPVTRATLIDEAMKRAQQQHRERHNEDALHFGHGAGDRLIRDDSSRSEVPDWAAMVALLQDPRMKTLADDTLDQSLSRIARRRASECMSFSRETFLLYIQHRAKEIAMQTASLGAPHSATETPTSPATSPPASAAATAWSLGLFSRRVKKEAVLRRYLRFRAYARIWACIDIDQSGQLDAAELRAYVRQRQTLENPRAIYSKTFADWSLREMHAHFCMWLGASARANQKFQRYDADGSGLITWEEFVVMADRAFRDEAMDELSFSVSQGFGQCSAHGKAKVYSIDLTCVACEIARHDPSRTWDREIFASLNPDVLLKVKTVAGRMLHRLSYSVHDDAVPLARQARAENARVLEMLSPSVRDFAAAFSTAEASLANIHGESEDARLEVASKGPQAPPDDAEGISPARDAKDSLETANSMRRSGRKKANLQLESVPSSTSMNSSKSKRRKTRTPKRRTTVVQGLQRKTSSRRVSTLQAEDRPARRRTRALRRPDRLGKSHLQLDRLKQRHVVNTTSSSSSSSSSLLGARHKSQALETISDLSFLESLTTEVSSFRNDRGPVAPKGQAQAESGAERSKSLRRSTQDAKRLDSDDVPEPPSEDDDDTGKSRRAAERRESQRLLQSATAESMIMFAKHGNVEQAKRLLAGRQVDPSVQVRGRSPLHVAAAAGQVEMAQTLIAAGADIGAVDCEGRTAAQVAVRAGFVDLARRLNGLATR